MIYFLIKVVFLFSLFSLLQFQNLNSWDDEPNFLKTIFAFEEKNFLLSKFDDDPHIFSKKKEFILHMYLWKRKVKVSSI
jgi:hypothetical protein